MVINRGHVFRSRSTGAIFITENNVDVYDYREADLYANGYSTYGANGRLIFPDGTVYRINSGRVTLIRDRNGNQVKLAYEADSINKVNTITDSLGRVITIAYGLNDETYGTHDRITFKGTDSIERYIRVATADVTTVLRSDLGTTPTNLFSNINGGTAPVEGTVTSAIWLPHGQKYSFRYNFYSEVARIELPTGGAIEYDYAAGANGGFASGQINRDLRDFYASFTDPNPFITMSVYRRVTKRRVYPFGGSGVTGVERETTFGRPETVINLNSAFHSFTNVGYVEVTHSGTGGSTPTEHHYFHGAGAGGATGATAATHGAAYYMSVSPEPASPDPYQGKEWKTEIVGLRKTQQLWGIQPGYVARICETRTTLLDITPSQWSINHLEYDASGNEIRRYEGALQTSPAEGESSAASECAAPAAYERLTTSLYEQDGNYTSVERNLIRLLKTRTVQGTGGVFLSRTRYGYDESSIDAQRTNGIIGHGSTDHADLGQFALTARGNLTSVKTWLADAPAASIPASPVELTSSATYDTAGNVLTTLDPKGNANTAGATLEYSYTDSFKAGGGFTYAFPTSVKNAYNHQVTTSYYFDTGAPYTFTNPNSGITTFSYADSLDRLTSVSFPVGSASYGYADTPVTTASNYNLKITTGKPFSSCGTSHTISSEVFFDGLGRKIRSALQEDSEHILSDTTYDTMGRVLSISNPYRNASSTVAAPSGRVWATTSYDGLGRATSVSHQDGQSTTSAYAGPFVTETDQAGVQRALMRNSLDQVTFVTEYKGTTQVTSSYVYDALNNLTSACVAGTFGVGGCTGQLRSFTYDTLSRLKAATNPESGTISYTYDANSNLSTRSQATGTTTFAVDKLNRVRRKTYSGTASGGMGQVTYCFDGTNADASFSTDCGTAPIAGGLTGRLTLAKNGSITTKYPTYDAMGNVTSSTFEIDSNSYSMSYAYNTGSMLETQTYHSQNKTKTCYDRAGRFSNVQSDPGSLVYAKAESGSDPENSGNTLNSYAPHGAPQRLKLGNSIVEATHYNSRLQPTKIGAWHLNGASYTRRLQLDFGYGTLNNGNVRTQTINENGPTAWTQTYTYDTLNRLETFSETGGSANPKQDFGYDSYGNRAVLPTSNYLPYPSWTPQAANANAVAAQFAGNRWNGALYDNAGNQLRNFGTTGTPGSSSYTYDVENRITTATVPNTGAISYSYDADGRRVKKTVGTAVTHYVHDASGALAAEYSTVAPTYNGVLYVTSDHLGSTRLLTNPVGGAHKRYDYTPFGEEIRTGWGGRGSLHPTGAYPSTPGVVSQEFTGKERDSETGLDYFGARYFSGAMGRFTSADPVIVTPARMMDPQRFNLYAYARNNPFKFIDPNGEDIEFVNDTEEGRKKGLALITRNLSAKEAANIGIRQTASGSHEAYVIDKKAVGKGASDAYKQLTGLIGDHSIVADVGVIGGGLTATFKEGALAGSGPISSWSQYGSIFEPNPGSKHVNVLVTQGDIPGGAQVWCCNGKGVYQGVQPDFVTMWHELMGETLKYRAGHQNLQSNPQLDSRTVIKIENEIRAVHGMNPRTGLDHGQTIITVQGKVQ